MRPGDLIIVGVLAWLLIVNRRPIYVEPIPVFPVVPWSPPWWGKPGW